MPLVNPSVPAVVKNTRYVGVLSRKLESAPVVQNICHAFDIPSVGPTALRIISAGCIVINIPINSIATSLIAPQLKWFFVRISFLVVLNDKNADKRIIAISIIVTNEKVTSPICSPLSTPSAPMNAGTLESVPLNTTAITIVIINITLCPPWNLSSVDSLLMSGTLPSAISSL